VAQRVFLHVGTPKTGTTYLQSVLWGSREKLREQGLLLPLNRVRDHYYLSNIARAADRVLDNMPEAAHSLWDRMLTEVRDWEGDALISHELFAVCSAERARWTTKQLGTVSDEVHVIVTARDLARQVPAEWQQTIKHGRSHRLSEFYDELRSAHPTVIFWRVQDLPELLARWSHGLPANRAHIVTVPPSGAPRDLLWRRFASLIGVDPDSVDLSVDMPNESLGVEEVETLRRVNLHAPEGEHPRQQLLIRQVLAEGLLAARPGATKFAPPADEHPWVVERGTQMVEDLRRAAYDVVGDLDELLPSPDPVRGPNPDDVPDAAVAAVAVQTISQLLYRSHELETQPLATQAAQLQERLAARAERLQRLERRAHNLEKQLADARAAFRDERSQPLKVHLRRRAGLVKRRVLRQPLP
jgi:hypothetical protein